VVVAVVEEVEVAVVVVEVVHHGSFSSITQSAGVNSPSKHKDVQLAL